MLAPIFCLRFFQLSYGRRRTAGLQQCWEISVWVYRCALLFFVLRFSAVLRPAAHSGFAAVLGIFSVGVGARYYFLSEILSSLTAGGAQRVCSGLGNFQCGCIGARSYFLSEMCSSPTAGGAQRVCSSLGKFQCGCWCSLLFFV